MKAVAADVVFDGDTVHRDAAKWTPEEAEAFKAPVRKKYEDEGNPYYATARLWDPQTGRPVGVFHHLGRGATLAINQGGHYHSSGPINHQLVVAVLTSQGQETMSPERFAQKHGWKNDPSKVRFSAR